MDIDGYDNIQQTIFNESGSTSSQTRLSSDEQWQNFIAHHCKRWRGVLVRYDGTGHVLDVLDSVRNLIPADDQSSVTHALDFRSRLTKTVRQKQWTLVPGAPLIIHPVDPTADLIFNRNASDAMVGEQRTNPEGFYFEPYLISGNTRTSVVVMYKAESAQPDLLSLFREVKDEHESWWSEEVDCKTAHLTQLTLPQTDWTWVSLNEMTQATVSAQPYEVQGKLIQFQFPDAVQLTVSPDRFETPYYAALSWQPKTDQASRNCTLVYTQPDRKVELWST